jgi:cyclase
MVSTHTTVTVTEVADGIIAAVGADGVGGRSNSTIILRSGAAAVIDTMLLPELAQPVLDVLAARQAPVRLVVNTHSHTDHVGGNAAFPGVPIMAHPVTARLTAQLASDTSFLGRLFPEYAAELSDLRIRVPDPIRPAALGVAPGVCLLNFGPAHSHADLVAWLPESRVLVAGDLCFNRVTPLALPHHASIRKWIAALDELIALKPDAVIPGHGPVADAGALTSTRVYLASLMRVAAAVVAGDLGRDEAVATFDVASAAGWAEPGRTRLNMSVAVAELGGPAPPLPPGVPVPVGTDGEAE